QTGGDTRLTYTQGYEGAPAWSPDGQWLVYEAYTEDNLDIYITRIDGTQGPIRLTFDAAPEFSPAWSPGGREIIFVSLRDGNRDIFLLSLDDPSDEAVRNLTQTPGINESDPAWAPDGTSIAYSAIVDGLEAVYVLPLNTPGAEPVVIDRGRAPAWSPDGGSLVYALDQGDRTLLVAGQYQTVGVTSQAVALPGRGGSANWTAWRPGRTAGLGSQQAEPPYEEQISFAQQNPPYYRLVLLGDVEAPNPYLSDRVNDSFNALREAVLEQTGDDYLGTLEDAFWALDRLPEPGQERLNWHMTGRAFALNRNLIYGFPPPLEIVREEIGVRTYWRVYARAAIQDGQLGEPLRDLPWDFSARSGGDVQAYEEGGRLRASVPTGYYVDLTQLFEDYGWQRLPADRSWRYNFSGVLFWEVVKMEGLSWEEAMLEIYSAAELEQFLTAPTAFPTSTLAPPTFTPEPTRTPTPVPPDQTP
ncbi:MAG: PD40 domain-containing protein, partial [Anaerolineae bacterium]|nr:PD40 domain-containing protein [Anaerolineae bacterium]